MKEVLKIENLKKYYGVNNNITKAIDGISFKVIESEFVAIMGASGSGKTTLLNCISTIDTVTSGHIYIDNKDITTVKEDDLADFRRENLGFIFQDFNLLDTLTIPLRDNDIETFNMIAKRIGVSDRVKLLEIHNNTETLTQLFDDSDFVAFVPQKRIVKDVPNSLIDGIVRGKPIIISDVIDFSQEVKKYEIGIVVPGGEKAKK